MSRAVRIFIHICFLTIVVVCMGCEQGADFAFDAQAENSLFVIVEGFNGGNPTARSIMPNEQHDLTGGGLSFTLSGVSNTGKRVDEMAVDIADGTAVIPLEPMLWNLTLIAYKGTGGEAIPVLRGFSVADMRTGSASVHFVLSSDGLYGNGTVTIKANIPHNNVAANITVGVYRKSSPDQPISGTEQAFNTIAGGNIALNYTATIPAGNYLLCISCQSAEGTPCGSYCDTLIVEPGLDTARDFGTLDIAARLPTAPDGLLASLGDASPDGSTYRVTLSWTCGQYADRYELQLTTAGVTTVYSADGADGTERFAGAPIYGGGNLLYGSTGCELLLAPGTYTVRLRARNEYGVSSDWGNAVFTEGLTVP